MADSGNPWTLLSLLPLPVALVEGLVEGLPVTVVAPEELTEDAVVAVADRADLILGGWGGEVPVNARVLAAASKLAAIQQPSVGVDTIDIQDAARRDVPVSNVAAFNAQSVAEWCVGATFAALRLLIPGDREVRDGGWPQLELAGRGSRELAGSRVGIVGFGAIGQACARMFSALGCEVGQWSRRRRDEEPWFELPDLVERSDILVVVVALAPATTNLLDAELLARLPHGAVLINAARGGIVEERAVADAIGSGRLAAAAFDVFATEPLPPDSPLRNDTRILLSPHAAGSTRQSQSRLIEGITANLARAVRGEPMLDVVNGVDPVVRRR